jgi:hypothetical protein
MSDLRKATIELAHDKPELRADLLPILEKAGAAKKTPMRRVQGTKFQIDWVQEVYWSEQQWEEEEPEDYPIPMGEVKFTKTSVSASPYALWRLGESDRWNGILMNIEDGYYVDRQSAENMTDAMYGRLLATQEASVREISDRLTSAGSPTPELGSSFHLREFVREYYKFQLYNAVQFQYGFELDLDTDTKVAKKRTRLWKALDWDSWREGKDFHPIENKFWHIEQLAKKEVEKARKAFKYVNMRQIDREITKIMKRTDKDLMSLVSDFV